MSSAVLNSPIASTPKRSFREQMHLAREDGIVSGVNRLLAEKGFEAMTVEEVAADPAIVDYLMAVVERTRTSPRLRMGVSPRGAIGLYRASRAFALTRGRTYLVPDDVRELVIPCLAHRILPAGTSGASLDTHEQAAQILEGILEEVEAPL